MGLRSKIESWLAPLNSPYQEGDYLNDDKVRKQHRALAEALRRAEEPSSVSIPESQFLGAIATEEQLSSPPPEK